LIRVNFRFERFCTLGVDLLFVHAARVKIADFLIVRAGGCLRVRRLLLQNLVQQLAISFRQLVEAAPARICGRNRICFQPFAARILIKILARLAGLVDDR
jgi:hypothetical protein